MEHKSIGIECARQVRDAVLVSPSAGSLMINMTPVAQNNDPT